MKSFLFICAILAISNCFLQQGDIVKCIRERCQDKVNDCRNDASCKNAGQACDYECFAEPNPKNYMLCYEPCANDSSNNCIFKIKKMPN